MLGKHVIFHFSSINYMFSVNYIIFLNITYVFAIIKEIKSPPDVFVVFLTASEV